MQQLLAVALCTMQQDMQRLDRVAVNLANASTPGYKREVVSARPFVEVMDEVMAPGEAASDLSAGVVALGNPALQIVYDSRPGTVKLTGEPLDVALTGDGFFEVSTDNGPAYTRQGNFKVDMRGRLVTAQGFPVAGKSGDIYLTTQTPVIDQAGNITEPAAPGGASAAAPGSAVAQLKVVKFDDPNKMERLGEGLLAAGSGLKVLDDTEARLRQGALENSNVSAMQEMVQMMQTMRHFESMQKVVQGFDEMTDSAIRKLGDLS